MALSQSSTCSQVGSLVVHADLSRPQSPKAHQGPSTVTPVAKNDAPFLGSALRSSAGRQTRSMAAAFKAPKPVAIAALQVPAVSEGADAGNEELDQAAAPLKLVSQASEEIAATSGEFLDAVGSVIEDGAANMRVRKSSGKSATTRTSRRRALVMCLALGMVRPCAAGNLRRSTSSSLRRSASSSFTVSGNLASQVSIASSLKAANLLDDKEDTSAAQL